MKSIRTSIIVAPMTTKHAYIPQQTSDLTRKTVPRARCGIQQERAMQWPRQKVSYHRSSSHMIQLNLTSFDEMMNQEVTNFNMSRSLTS
jgi:hypothetical protein